MIDVEFYCSELVCVWLCGCSVDIVFIGYCSDVWLMCVVDDCCGVVVMLV